MEETAEPHIFLFGPYEVDLKKRELRKFGTRIKLQAKPFSVLEVLVTNHGDLISRDQLRRALWPDDNVFVDFDKNLATAVNKLRDALCDTAEQHRYIETIPRAGYRFVAEVRTSDPVEKSDQAIVEPPAPAPAKKRSNWIGKALAVVAAVAIIVYSAVLFSRSKPAGNLPTVVVSDIENFTGEQVFNGPIRRGLAVGLNESDRFAILSDSRIGESLTLMERPQDSPVIGSIADEVCQRSGSVAQVGGSITSLGSQYVLVLKASNCWSGEVLAEEQITADRREKVIDSLGLAATRLRRSLGQSIGSIQSQRSTQEAVTTSSFSALQSYTLGYSELVQQDDPEDAMKFFQQAIEYDPNFAMAYAALGESYGMIGEETLARENVEKAYDLRDRVSQREKFYILYQNADQVSGDADEALRSSELWVASFPNDSAPHAALGTVFSELGDYDKSLTERQQALRLSPTATNYRKLAETYIALRRLDDARATFRDALTHRVDSAYLQLWMYRMAIIEGNQQEASLRMERMLKTSGFEAEALDEEADVRASLGQLATSRELAYKAADSAKRAGLKESAAIYLAKAALRQALAGDHEEARKMVSDASALFDGNKAEMFAALALALSGDRSRGDRTATKVETKYPNNTAGKFNYLPSLRAASALARGDAPAALAISTIATPYEMGSMGVPLQPVYLRGLAYLSLGDSQHAILEFQKLTSNPGILNVRMIRLLAQLGLARAYVLNGEISKAISAYETLFAALKGADPDMPALVSAKKEYAKLQH